MRYDDIINMPHFHAKGRPFMSNRDRAAQFMPFKSLKGYEDLVSNKSDYVLNSEWELIEYEDTIE